jgi:tetratricopeptide (TPR) repeat protein
MSNTLTTTLSVSISFSLLLSCAQAVCATDDLSQKLTRADELLNKGKARAAAAILRELIRSHPENAQAHMELGAALASLVDNDNYDMAIAEEQQALKLDAKSYGARKILGHIYANLNKSEESITILKEACQISPTSYGAQRDLGIAYLAAGNIDEAINAFKKAIELKPKKMEAHLKLSILLSKKGNFRDAIAEASEAVQLAGGNAETHLTLANIMLESGDKAGAIDSFKNAIQANGFDAFGCRNPIIAADAFSGLGWAIATRDTGKKDLEESILDQRKAIKAFPPFLPAYVRLAELLSRKDKNKEAEAVFKTGLKLSSNDPGISTSYAKFLDRIGRKDDARSILKKVLEKSPDFKPASDAQAVLEQSKTK